MWHAQWFSVGSGLNRESKGQVSATGRALSRLGIICCSTLEDVRQKRIGVVASVCILYILIQFISLVFFGDHVWCTINSFDALGLLNKHSQIGQLNLHPWLGCFWPCFEQTAHLNLTRQQIVDLPKSYSHDNNMQTGNHCCRKRLLNPLRTKIGPLREPAGTLVRSHAVTCCWTDEILCKAPCPNTRGNVA